MKGSFTAIINSEDLVLVDFFATWCGPCKAMTPILKQVKETIGEAVKIIKIDVDINPSVAQNYQVRGVPTLVLFKNGKPVWRTSGVLAAQDIIAILQSKTI